MARFTRPEVRLDKDPRLSVARGTTGAQDAYVETIQLMHKHFTSVRQGIMDKIPDWWDLFLAQQADNRDPVDEAWRSDVFVPLPYTTTRTKAAQTTELLGNTEPIWQVEATKENSPWYEQSKSHTRLLDYVHRHNRWRKFIYKMATSRSVQGTTFMKIVWTKRSHVVTLFPSQAEQMEFDKRIDEALSLGAPEPYGDPYTDPKNFERWRTDINMVKRFGYINAPPTSGPKQVVNYEGPLFQQLPIWSVILDPLIDEMENQPVVIHRMVKPLKFVLDRADNDPNSPLPYFLDNVIASNPDGMPGEILDSEHESVAASLNINPDRRTHPYFERPTELWEVWSPDEEFRYAIIMNQKYVINKRPFEHPLLTQGPNILALRNVVVPGFFYGLSDYQEPEKLFRELNDFRRIRMDGATLNTLPVFVKAQGIHLAEALQKIKPGLILTLPRADAIQSLIKHQLPAEAYREPAEIKLEIEDATEVYSSTKGAPATVGRVTGTEFQGRAQNVLLKYKVDASIIEEELAALPQIVLSMFAQMGPERVRLQLGGDPDALVDLSREQLVEGLDYRFHFRGATKNIHPDLQVQQLTTALSQFADAMTVPERRFALGLILELLDIRGYSRMLTIEGESLMGGAQQTGIQAGNQVATQQGNAAEAAGVQVPGAMTPEAAASATQEATRKEGAAPSGPGAEKGSVG